MTNYERIKSMTIEEMADEFCGFYEDIEGQCDYCIAKDYCRWSGGKSNGFAKWLEKESD